MPDLRLERLAASSASAGRGPGSGSESTVTALVILLTAACTCTQLHRQLLAFSVRSVVRAIELEPRYGKDYRR